MDSSNATKIFISEEQHIIDSYQLGAAIFASDYRPTFVLGVWRGGSTVALAVQECLAYLGVATNHITVRTSYEGRDQYERSVEFKENIRVHGKSYALESICAEDRLLIVDDVYHSGRHTTAVKEALIKGLRRNMPSEVRVAALWRRTDADAPQPDYFLYETDNWLVLPYEMRGISEDELRKNKPFLDDFLS